MLMSCSLASLATRTLTLTLPCFILTLSTSPSLTCRSLRTVMSALTPWQRRFRKLAVFAGTLSSLYLLANYTFERLRESRVRSTKDRQIKDR